MNLLELLKQEVKALKLTTKEEIAYYLYIRTGEIFDFNPSFKIRENKNKQDTIMKKRINIRNVTSYFITCSTWTYLYKDLLEAFGIDANDEHYNDYSHYWVEIPRKEEYILADMTAGYKDFFSIKFGLPVNNFDYKSKRKLDIKQFNQKMHYFKGIEIKEILEMIKHELQEKYQDKEEYFYAVFQVISLILNVHRNGVGYESGKEYIDYLCKFFLGKYHYNQTTFYDKNIFIRVYMFLYKGVKHYFAYQKLENGYFELHEITNGKFLAYKREYYIDKPHVLSLIQ